ncbi:hypothetical protein ACFS07_19230 [Undibacterium arcticum]
MCNLVLVQQVLPLNPATSVKAPNVPQADARPGTWWRRVRGPR